MYVRLLRLLLLQQRRARTLPRRFFLLVLRIRRGGTEGTAAFGPEAYAQRIIEGGGRTRAPPKNKIEDREIEKGLTFFCPCIWHSKCFLNVQFGRAARAIVETIL